MDLASFSSTMTATGTPPPLCFPPIADAMLLDEPAPPTFRKRPKRDVDIAIISDLHLGTRNCQVQSLLNYIYSIRPKTLVLLGDVFDITQKDRNFWPKEHTHVVRRILKLAAKGTPVYYVTGNHDALLRQYSGTCLANIRLVDRLEWDIDGKKTFLTHGDIFDIGVGLPMLRTVGGWSYDAMMRINRLYNKLRSLLGLKPFSLVRFIKSKVAKATTYVQRYEATARKHAADRGFDTVICGHIHQPKIIEANDNDELVQYLNSGDWTTHCTALEHDGQGWNLHWEPQRIDQDEDEPEQPAGTSVVAEELLEAIPAA